jgi:sugar lactone lactonase YvrE
VGEPVSFRDLSFTKAWIAPGSNQALGAAADGKLYRIDLRDRTISIAGDYVPQDVIWSPTGATWAFVFDDASTSTVAISDDGAVLLAVRTTSTGTSLFAIRDREEQILLSAPGLSRAAFLSGTHDAVVWDTAERKLYLLRNGSELSLVAQVEAVDALAAAPDNSRVFVASKEQNRITSVRLSDGLITSVDCACAPETLERLEGNLFRVTTSSRSPMWLFDSESAERPFTFVPPPETANE